MLRLLTVLAVAWCCARVEAQPAPIERGWLEREVALRQRLDELADREEHRVLWTSLGMGLGGGLVTVGAVFHDRVGSVLIPLGASLVAQGVIRLAVVDDPAAWRARYLAVPASGPAQVRARVLYGEQILARLAFQSRRQRIANGVVQILSGAAMATLGYAFSRAEDPRYRWGDNIGDWLLLSAGGLQAVSGVLSFFDESPAEGLSRSYREAFARQPKLALHGSGFVLRF